MALDFGTMSLDDLRLLKNQIENQIHLKTEAEKRTKINAFRSAFMDLNKLDIPIYVSVPNDVWEHEASSFPLDWDDLSFD